MAKLENRKMFANFPGFDKIVSNVSDLYSGIGTLPQRSTLDIAGQFIAQNPQAFSGTADQGTKLPSGAAIMAQDLKNLFGGISAGKQTDELLRSQMADEKQSKILDTSLDIYKESLSGTDEKLTELEGFREKLNGYYQKVQNNIPLEDWEKLDMANLEAIIANRSTEKYEVKDFIEYKKDIISAGDAAKDTMIQLNNIADALSDPSMATNPVAETFQGFVAVTDALGMNVDGILNAAGFPNLTAETATAEQLNFATRALALALAPKLSGSKSDFEVRQLLKSVPNLGASLEANKKLLNDMIYIAQKQIAYSKFASESNSRDEYNEKVTEYDNLYPSPFNASETLDSIRASDDSFMGLNLDADEGSYVIEGQSD